MQEASVSPMRADEAIGRVWTGRDSPPLCSDDHVENRRRILLSILQEIPETIDFERTLERIGNRELNGRWRMDEDTGSRRHCTLVMVVPCDS